MPTILNTKEETDKTVPIDTSGESMDIEIENKHDENEHKEAPTEEVAEVEEQQKKETTEEGEEYSQAVKKISRKFLTSKLWSAAVW